MFFHHIHHLFSLINLQQLFYMALCITILVLTSFFQKSVQRKASSLDFSKEYLSVIGMIFGNLTKIVCIIFALLFLDEIEGINASAILHSIVFLSFGTSFIFKDLITDFASGFFILYYKPFKIGQWVNITIDDNLTYAGEIKSISTRYTTLNNERETVVIPNFFLFKHSVCIMKKPDLSECSHCPDYEGPSNKTDV